MVGEARQQAVGRAAARRRGVPGGAATALLLLACHEPPATSQVPKRGPSAVDDSPSASVAAPAHDDDDAGAIVLPPLPDGCFGHPDAAPPARLLEHLVENCAPGTAALGKARPLSDDGEARFELDAAPRCLRAFVVTSSRAQLTAELLAPSGEVLASSSLPAGFAVLAPSGPVCTREGGTFRIRTNARGPSALATLHATEGPAR